MGSARARGGGMIDQIFMQHTNTLTTYLGVLHRNFILFRTSFEICTMHCFHTSRTNLMVFFSIGYTTYFLFLFLSKTVKTAQEKYTSQAWDLMFFYAQIMPRQAQKLFSVFCNLCLQIQKTMKVYQTYFFSMEGKYSLVAQNYKLYDVRITCTTNNVAYFMNHRVEVFERKFFLYTLPHFNSVFAISIIYSNACAHAQV